MEALVKDKGVARKDKFEGIRRQTMVYEQKYNTGKMCGNRLRQKSGIKIEAVSKAKTVSFYMFFFDFFVIFPPLSHCFLVFLHKIKGYYPKKCVKLKV